MPDLATPLRADHRFLKKLLGVILSGKVEYVPQEFDLVARVFVKSGGSWAALFQGSPEEVRRLKKVAKLAYKKGYLTKKYQWGGGGQTQSDDGQDGG